METIQVVLDKKLLQATDHAARHTRQNRSALVRDALREHLRQLALRALEDRDPVVVLTRDSAVGYLSTVTVAPIASSIRGVPSEVVLDQTDGMKTSCAINLHNAVTVSQHRLGRRLTHLSSTRMNEVCASLRFSIACDD